MICPIARVGSIAPEGTRNASVGPVVAVVAGGVVVGLPDPATTVLTTTVVVVEPHPASRQPRSASRRTIRPYPAGLVSGRISSSGRRGRRAIRPTRQSPKEPCAIGQRADKCDPGRADWTLQIGRTDARHVAARRLGRRPTKRHVDRAAVRPSRPGGAGVDRIGPCSPGVAEQPDRPSARGRRRPVRVRRALVLLRPVREAGQERDRIAS